MDKLEKTYNFLAPFFLMVTGYLLLAIDFVFYPIILVNLDAMDFSFSGWIAGAWLIVLLVWSVYFMFRGIKLMKEKSKKEGKKDG